MLMPPSQKWLSRLIFSAEDQFHEENWLGINRTGMSHYDTPSGTADVVILRDQEEYIPLTTILDENDVIVLLTPLVVPLPRDADAGVDPFESFGRALALRHPQIRHVPYTARDGITGYHVAHIHRAKAIIFVISGKPIAGQPSQADIAEVAWMVGNTRPQIVLACYDVQGLGLLKAEFPAIIQLPSYSPLFLQQAAAVLFGESLTRNPVDTTPQQKWAVEALPDELVALDVTPFERLWNKCLPDQFQLDKYSLRTLLDRVGWSRHYVVKLPGSGEIIGFCATYTTFLNGGDADLVGSIAVILVEPAYRQRGIGKMLHDEALFQLKRVRGVRRLQLGSTFPVYSMVFPRDLPPSDGSKIGGGGWISSRMALAGKFATGFWISKIGPVAASQLLYQISAFEFAT
ncbi:glycoside hydrolase family 3 [Apiospora phragmitis]|uniref:Glycoside hydrolase family 3 n=1 Tax=Apiospora phragmitis TaxID=2905665 RepID=A0ABR1T475_9PEZI